MSEGSDVEWYCGWCKEPLDPEDVRDDGTGHVMATCPDDGIVYALDDPDADYEAVWRGA